MPTGKRLSDAEREQRRADDRRRVDEACGRCDGSLEGLLHVEGRPRRPVYLRRWPVSAVPT